MDLLIDTNAFLWFCEDNSKLSIKANFDRYQINRIW
jgi:PIN domain nuclease of toxin-antitoxin system